MKFIWIFLIICVALSCGEECIEMPHYYECELKCNIFSTRTTPPNDSVLILNVFDQNYNQLDVDIEGNSFIVKPWNELDSELDVKYEFTYYVEVQNDTQVEDFDTLYIFYYVSNECETISLDFGAFEYNNRPGIGGSFRGNVCEADFPKFYK